MRLTPTAPIAAASLIAGYAIAASTGIRPLGGAVMLIGGAWCILAWRRRHGAGTAVLLGSVGLVAFVGSHVLAKAIGAWPSVLLLAAVTSAVVWMRADAQRAV